MCVTNDEGKRVWLGPCFNKKGERIGITDCCLESNPCKRHRAALAAAVDAEDTAIDICHECGLDDNENNIRNIAAIIRKHTGQPKEGWVLVPRIPTAEMYIPVTNNTDPVPMEQQQKEARTIWEAMLAAAPQEGEE
jgi:hypothetical protein